MAVMVLLVHIIMIQPKYRVGLSPLSRLLGLFGRPILFLKSFLMFFTMLKENW